MNANTAPSRMPFVAPLERESGDGRPGHARLGGPLVLKGRDFMSDNEREARDCILRIQVSGLLIGENPSVSMLVLSYVNWDCRLITHQLKRCVSVLRQL